MATWKEGLFSGSRLQQHTARSKNVGGHSLIMGLKFSTSRPKFYKEEGEGGGEGKGEGGREALHKHIMCTQQWPSSYR